MNKQNLSAVPDEDKIEELLTKIQPMPSGDFHKKMEQAHWRTEQVRSKVITNKLRLKLAVTVVVLLAITMFAVTPQGRAWAQGVLQFFTRAEQDQYPLQPWQMTPPAQTASESPFQFSVQEAEELAGYAVLSPVEMPFGMMFVGADYDTQNYIVAQAFGYSPDSNELSLWQQPLEYHQSCGNISNFCDNMLGGNLVGSSANVEAVQIGDLQGEYVEGVWELTDNGPVWNPAPYLKTLRWQTQSMAFELVYMGVEFGKDDLLAFAASIH